MMIIILAKIETDSTNCIGLAPKYLNAGLTDTQNKTLYNAIVNSIFRILSRVSFMVAI